MRNRPGLVPSVLLILILLLPSITQAIPIKLFGEFKNTTDDTIKFKDQDKNAEQVLTEEGLTNRINPTNPPLKLTRQTNKEGEAKELPTLEIGATRIETGTAPTSVTFRPVEFDSTACSSCIIGELDIFNGISSSGTSGSSFILELTLPAEFAGKTQMELGINPDNFSTSMPAEFWFFIKNTPNSPTDVDDEFSFAEINDPTNPTKTFFIGENVARNGLGLRANLNLFPPRPTGIIPEPNTLLLLGTGLFGLLGLRWKSSKNMSKK